jgi:hypothetical protein
MLESGALSDETFPAFAKTVVPFLHVTTKIDGHPYDGLLKEKGFGGFPTLAFADAEGQVLGQPGERSVASFAAARDALVALPDVEARAAAGEPTARVELLLLEHALAKVRGPEFIERAAAVRGDATPEQIVRLDRILLDERARQFAMRTYQGDEREKDAAIAGMRAMIAAGELPTPRGNAAITFWSALARHAEQTGDTALLSTCVERMPANLPADEGSERWIESLREKLVFLGRRDALVARVEAGEQGLEAQILVLEARLQAVTLARFRERLAAALRVATDDERAELARLEVECEVRELVDGYWSERERDPIAERLLVLIEGHGAALSDEALGLAGSCVAQWATSSKDPARMERCAAALESAGGTHASAKRQAETLRAAAAKLRAAEKP